MLRLHLEDDKNKKQADKKLQIQKIVIFQACCDSLSTSGIQEVCSSEQRNTKDLTLKMFISSVEYVCTVPQKEMKGRFQRRSAGLKVLCSLFQELLEKHHVLFSLKVTDELLRQFFSSVLLRAPSAG